ncbi:hypothetical protein D3C83_116330 [compost metagenome]
MLDCERIAEVATASVGETIAPSTKAAAHGISGTSHFSTTPTTSVVAITRATASTLMGRAFSLKSRQEVRSAPW